MVRLPSRKDLAARVDQLERDLVIFGAGGGVGAALARSPALRAVAGPAALRLTPAALLADLVIRQEESLAYQAGEFAGRRFEGTEPAGVRTAIVGREALPAIRAVTGAVKRKVSKANKAVKQGMAILKSGTKAQTGSVPGTLPAGAFKIATKAAGLANPNSKSIIGKGKSKIKALARKLKKWW